jgi:hypothetical protein
MVSPSSPLQILCEGRNDKALYKGILAARNIASYEVTCARLNRDPTRCAGKSAFKESLEGLVGFAELNPGTLKGVIIACDSDENPIKEFNEIARLIKEIGLKAPAGALDIVPPKKNRFGISVMTIPFGNPGNLEVVLEPAIRSRNPDLIPPTDNFCRDTAERTGAWSANKKSKMRFRCFVAGSHEDDPSASTSFILESSRQQLFDFADPTFNVIADFLNRFALECGV